LDENIKSRQWYTDHICARVVWTRPDWDKTDLASIPNTHSVIQSFTYSSINHSLTNTTSHIHWMITHCNYSTSASDSHSYSIHA